MNLGCGNENAFLTAGWKSYEKQKSAEIKSDWMWKSWLIFVYQNLFSETVNFWFYVTWSTEIVRSLMEVETSR